MPDMSAGWQRFGWRQREPSTGGPDKPVAAPPAWLLGAAIFASTAVLLGTTEEVEPPPAYVTSYSFARTGVDGGFVELTRDLPTATFFVSVRADALGPEGVHSTNGASMLLDGTVTTSGLNEGAVTPVVNATLSSPDMNGAVGQLVQDSFMQTQTLTFTGDCDHPSSTGSCRARFALQVSRNDEGASGGVVRFDWSFDVASSGQEPSKKTSSVGPLDPPWTIEVSQP
jgi:hypothetical protein